MTTSSSRGSRTSRSATGRPASDSTTGPVLPRTRSDHCVARHVDDLDARRPVCRRRRHGFAEHDPHDPRRHVPHLIDRRLEHQLARAQHADPIAHAVDFRQHVRRQEHGGPALTHIGEQRVEGLLHQRVEALGRLVQDEQRRIRLEGRDNGHLALHARAVFADAPVEIRVAEREPLQQFALPRLADRAGRQPGQQAKRLAPRHVAVEPRLAGHVADKRPRREAVGLAVVAENRGTAGAGPEQIEQQADRGGLAGAVQAQETEDLSGLDGQIERLHRDEAAEPLRQAVQSNRRRGSGHEEVPLAWILRPMAGRASGRARLQRPVRKPIAIAPPQLSCLKRSSR